MAAMEDFVVSKEINYAYIALSQNKFVLSDSSITINLSKCEKTLCFLCKSKKVPYSSFYKDEWFLYSSASVHFTLFNSDFVNITLDNYSQVETINLKHHYLYLLLTLFWLNIKSSILRKRLLKLLCQNYSQYIVPLTYRYTFSLLDKFFSLNWE